MKRRKWERDDIQDMVQLVTGITVVIGIGLVVWELSQSREMTSVELRDNVASRYSNLSVGLFGENPASTLAKACTEPDELTEEDTILLDWIYTSILTDPVDIIIQNRHSTFDSRAWVPRTTPAFSLIFQTKYGRYWWQENEEFYIERANLQLAQIGREVLEEMGPDFDCRARLDGYYRFLRDGPAPRPPLSNETSAP